ncbi:MAG: UvrD-helicase domain-containing protein, partial [Gaiellales bacterium]
MIRESWNAGQRAAIEGRGTVFVSAGAGTGKTAVLVERVARRLAGGTPLDHLLVITFTERAADELKLRIRARLREVGMAEAAGAVESAWISTIHGFCSRVLRSHALEAGIDPSFAVASDTEMRILQSEAFGEALERFVDDDRPERLDLLARYGRDRLRRMTVELHGRLRGLGLPLELHAHLAPDLAGAVEAARAAARAEQGDAAAEALLSLLAQNPAPAELCDLPEQGIPRRGALKEAVTALEQAAADVLADADRAVLESLLGVFDERYTRIKQGRGLLDFNDLELRARDLLRADPDVAAEYRGRFTEVMVDEFQDT